MLPLQRAKHSQFYDGNRNAGNWRHRTSNPGNQLNRTSHYEDIPSNRLGGCRKKGRECEECRIPDPVTKEARIIMPHMTSSIIIPPVPSIEAAALIIVVMPPVAPGPSAKTPAQIIKDTVEANTLPMPEKKDFIFSHDFLKLRV